MKQVLIFLFTIGFPGFQLFSQVVIIQSDMPVPGDTLRVSQTNVTPEGYAMTAMDTVWSYTGLEPLSQRVDTFVAATSTPSAYQLFFVILGGANLASPRSGSPIPLLPVTDGFTFYKTSTNSFSELGSAYTVQGLPLPAKYDNPDVHYTFPLQPGSNWSSTASFAVDVPDLVYFSMQRMRTSIVDGWGSITTPFGTFQTLRVKSTLTEHDSIYIDSLSAGFPFTRNLIEYKWLAKEQGIPVMQVTEEGSLVITSYRDIPRMSALPLAVTLGPDTSAYLGSSVTLHATVTGGTPPYSVVWNTLDTGAALTVTVQDIRNYSAVVIDALSNLASDEVEVSVRYPPGMGEQGMSGAKVLPNPTTGPIRFSLPGSPARAVCQVLAMTGKKVWESVEYPVSGEIRADLSGLPSGLYMVRVSTSDTVCYFKLQLSR